MVDNHTDPESLTKLSNTFTIMKLLDQMPTQLSKMVGVQKVALSYIVRYEPTPPDTLPLLQENLIWSLGNSSTMDELVAYTPHTGPSYEEDNVQVYNLLAKSLARTNDMTSITSHHCRRYGRSAYLDLVTYNMGSEKWENTVEQAESVLAIRI